MILRILKSIYPLLKDIFLEGKSIKQAAREKRGKLLILVGVLLSLCLNYILIPRSITLSAKVVELEQTLKETTVCDSGSINKQSQEPYDRRDYYNKYIIDNVD